MAPSVIPTAANPESPVRDETEPAPGHFQEFFQMFLFITFVTSEYIGRVRRLVGECALPRPRSDKHTIGTHIHSQQNRRRFAFVVLLTLNLTVLQVMC